MLQTLPKRVSETSEEKRVRKTFVCHSIFDDVRFGERRGPVRSATVFPVSQLLFFLADVHTGNLMKKLFVPTDTTNE